MRRRQFTYLNLKFATLIISVFLTPGFCGYSYGYAEESVLSTLGFDSTPHYSLCETGDGSPLCFNDGKCVEYDGEVRCTCERNFFGSRCEYRRCSTINPCINGGECEKTTGPLPFRCHCPLGFEGRYCSERLHTVCDDRPCSKGRCIVINSVNEYKCDCHFGFMGTNCTQVDYCAKARCLYGECVNTAQGHKCECSAGWAGAECDEDLNECTMEPCKNGALCINLPGNYICKCTKGFGGKNCEITIKDDSGCRDELCLNNGKCPVPGWQSTRALSTSQLDTPWSRFNALFVDAARRAKAGGASHEEHGSNGADEASNWRCSCPMGYFGARCEERVDECALMEFSLETMRDDGNDGKDSRWWEYACQNDGVCMGPGGSASRAVVEEAARAGLTVHTARLLGAVCKCPNGFTGEHCELDVDECATSTDMQHDDMSICGKHGRCINEYGRYRCECASGFTGEHCEINVDDCRENICYEGSTCVDGISSFTCLCADGRIGKFCEYEDPCYGDRNRCQHGHCYSDHLYGNYSCMCNSGYTGINCDHRCVGGYNCVTEPNCALGFCANNAVCLELDNDYECICMRPFAGRNCEVRLPAGAGVWPCALPCANGGACRRASDDEDRDRCYCTPGYRGELCETRIGENDTVVAGDDLAADCRLSACYNNGTCMQLRDNNGYGGTRYACECLPGFAGPLCQLDINECLAAPCENQARCVDLINGFRCDCAPGFAGARCEINVDECANVTCLHAGKCRDRVNGFSCECADDHAGVYCEVNLRAYAHEDETQRAQCRVNNCTAKAQNGCCDQECNFYACDFDGGDCALHNAQPFARCGALQSYCAHAFGDGKCDEACNVEECLFDGFDCVEGRGGSGPKRNGTEVSKGTEDRPERESNGIDESIKLNEKKKESTGPNRSDVMVKNAPRNLAVTVVPPLDPAPRTDAPASLDTSQLLSGELALIVLADEPDDFFRVLHRLLAKLSVHLRASLRVSLDDGRRAKIYAWRSDTGADESAPLALPAQWSAEALEVNYNAEGAKRVKRSVSVADDKTVFRGVKFYLRLDVAQCALNRIEATNFSACFSEPKSAAQFLSANSAKMRLNDLDGVRLYSADAVRMADPGRDGAGSVTSRGVLELVLAGTFVVILCAVVAIGVLPHRKRIMTKSIWRPPKLIMKKKGGLGQLDGYGDYSTSTTNITLPYSGVSGTSNSNRSMSMTSTIYAAQNATQQQQQKQQTTVTAINSYYAQQTQIQAYGSNSNGNTVSGGYGVPASHAVDALQREIARGNIYDYCNDYGGGLTTAGYDCVGGTTAAHTADCAAAQTGSYASSSSGVSSGQTSPNNESNAAASATADAFNSSGASATRVDSTSTAGAAATVFATPLPDLTLHRLLSSGTNINAIDVTPERLTARDANAQTALHALVETADICARTDAQLIENAARLIEAGADVNAQDKDRNTSLIIAIKKRRVELVAWLIERGADVNLADADDRTPLHIAIAGAGGGANAANAAIFRRLLACAEIELNAVDRRQRTPLALCAYAVGSAPALEFARQLIEHGADVNRVAADSQQPSDAELDNDGDDQSNTPTALHVAALVNNAPMVRLLLENKVNKDTKNLLERTPLALAAKCGNAAVVRELLEAGADRQLCDADEKTAVELACAARYLELGQLIANFEPSPVAAPSAATNGAFGYSSASPATTTTAAAASASTRRTSPYATSGGAHATKRARASPSAPRKEGIKACKARRVAQMVMQGSGAGHASSAAGAANNIMALTPPNSDLSAYSTTPSPNNNPVNACTMVTMAALPPPSTATRYSNYQAPALNYSKNSEEIDYYGNIPSTSALRLPLTLMATHSELGMVTGSNDELPYAISSYSSQIHQQPFVYGNINNNNNPGYSSYGNHYGTPYRNQNCNGDSSSNGCSAGSGNGNGGYSYELLSPPALCDKTPPRHQIQYPVKNKTTHAAETTVTGSDAAANLIPYLDHTHQQHQQHLQYADSSLMHLQRRYNFD